MLWNLDETRFWAVGPPFYSRLLSIKLSLHARPSLDINTFVMHLLSYAVVLFTENDSLLYSYLTKLMRSPIYRATLATSSIFVLTMNLTKFVVTLSLSHLNCVTCRFVRDGIHNIFRIYSPLPPPPLPPPPPPPLP